MALVAMRGETRRDAYVRRVTRDTYIHVRIRVHVPANDAPIVVIAVDI